jgi:hypothetical protein
MANRNFLRYASAGPLCYLLMDEEGMPKLGLYKDAFTNELVLIVSNFSCESVFYPGFDNLILALEDKLSLDDLLLKSRFATIDGAEPTLMRKLALKSWIPKAFSGLLSNQTSGTTYPNYYYVFHQYISRHFPVAV